MWIGPILGDIVTIDKTIVSWLIAAGGAFIMFLLSLGIKDLRDKLGEIPKTKEEVAELRAQHETKVAELTAAIRLLEERASDLRREIKELRTELERVHRAFKA